MNEQENLWKGKFGDDYTGRQKLNFDSTINFFGKALARAYWGNIDSVIEFGANEGHNLEAIYELMDLGRTTPLQLDGLEINPDAYNLLQRVTDEAFEGSILTFESLETWDLVLTKGLLIHIAPIDLPKAYRVLYESSARYILIAEYFNQTPVAIDYRGESAALFKRDFGGDMLDLYPSLTCLDYGFVWRRDEHPQDDLTWWLFDKGEPDEIPGLSPDSDLLF